MAETFENIRDEVLRRVSSLGEGAVAIADFHLPGGGIVDVAVFTADASAAIWILDAATVYRRTLSFGGRDGRRLDGFDFGVLLTGRCDAYYASQTGESPIGIELLEASAVSTENGLRFGVTESGRARRSPKASALLSVLRAGERAALSALAPTAPRPAIVAALRARVPTSSLDGQRIRDAWCAREREIIGDQPAVLIEEFTITTIGQAQGTIADFAAIRPDGLHLTEIKGDRDSFDRLARQVAGYNEVALTATIIVTSERRAGRVASIVPTWWSIVIAQAVADDSVIFRVVREGGFNATLSARQLRALLHRRELEQLVRMLGGRPSRHLYGHELARLVRPFLDVPTLSRTLAHFIARRSIVSDRRGVWEWRHIDRWPVVGFPERPLRGLILPVERLRVGDTRPLPVPDAMLPLFDTDDVVSSGTPQAS